MTQDNNRASIPDEHLEFIEKLLFHDLDEALKKQNEGHLNYDEVVAYENALETMTTIRDLLSDRNDAEVIEGTADHVFDVLGEEFDTDRSHGAGHARRQN